MILLQAEVLELKANPGATGPGLRDRGAAGAGHGAHGHVLVKNGTLKVGDAMLCGDYWGRVKALINDHGVKVRTAGPSHAVQCLGLTDVPEAGARVRGATQRPRGPLAFRGAHGDPAHGCAPGRRSAGCPSTTC